MPATREVILFFIVALALVISAAYLIAKYRGGFIRLLERFLYRGTYVPSEVADVLKEVFAKARSLEDLCVNLTETLVKTFKIDKTIFLLKDRSGRNFVPVYLRGFIDPSPFTFDSTDELISYARRRGGVFQIKEIKADAPARRQASEKLGKHGIVLLIPIEVRGELEGLICLGRKPSDEPYTARDISLLRIVSDMAGIALENVKLYSFLEKEEKQS